MTEFVTSVRSSPVPRSSWIALAILFVVSIFNFLDRTLIGILQIPMKEELQLSDTQLGMLLGAAFALVYTIFGLPVGRLGDHVSRKWLLAGALTVWTLLTAASGFATGFLTLMLCRMGVALGEAACAPLSHSLISDLFPRHRRASAVAVWGMGVPLGIIFGFLFGGWLNHQLGWRDSFIYVGLAGCLIVPLVMFVLKDPPRGAFDDPGADKKAPPPLQDVFRTMWANSTYRFILVAASLHLFTFHSISIWLPQFYARVYELPVAQVGERMALMLGVGSLLGMILGGFIGDRVARDDPRRYLWLSAAASVLLIPAALFQFWTGSLWLSTLIGVINGMLLQTFFSPMIALTQSLMPPRMRGLTGAFYVAFVNIFAMSVGPLVTGAMSDVLSARANIGQEALRYALTGSLVGSLLAIPFFLFAGRHVRRDLAMAGSFAPEGPAPAL